MAVATQYATGRRKCAIAEPGSLEAGDITINDSTDREVFHRLTLRQIIQFPLEIGRCRWAVLAQGHGTWRRTDRTSWRPASCNRTRVGGTQSAPPYALEEGRLADTGLAR